MATYIITGRPVGSSPLSPLTPLITNDQRIGSQLIITLTPAEETAAFQAGVLKPRAGAELYVELLDTENDEPQTAKTKTAAKKA